MWKQLLAFMVLTSLLACASITKTGIVKDDTFTDSHFNTQITKNENWDFYVPPEEDGINPWRFSLYRSEVGHEERWKKTGVGYDSVTGHLRYRKERDGISAEESSAEAHVQVVKTSLTLPKFRDSLLARRDNCEFAGECLLGEFGKGYHLTRTAKPYGDWFFTIRDGNAYVVEYFAWEMNYYRRCKEELEKMLGTLTIAH